MGFIIISGITGFLAKDNLKVIFLICTFIFVICLCLAFSFPEDKKTENNKTKQTVWLVLKNPRLLLLYAVAVVVNATVSIQGAFFGIYFVNTLGFSTSLLGIQAMLRLVMEIQMCIRDRGYCEY